MNRRSFLATSMAASAAVLLSACGFRLRGPMPSLPPLTLEGDTNNDMARQLAARLEQRSSSGDSVDWRVTLGSPTLDERRLGGIGYGSRDHDLTLSSTISVQRRDDNAYLLNSETVSVSTRIRVSDDDLLNRESLFSEAEQTLNRELAERIIERLSSLNNAS
ncbi:twin-arginine translocation signal domain-containing protein [Vreelandella gomseomensis]|uniref:Twin-arginine translocation signal domain-containing protein n=1 Tax=Vreelandella gomseomensis TaxID=370766 RepID=A0ABU1GBS5_9GAMM|nr:twin-arginine translocation signal domain-containing protein [Halomonas gomseomensis]MDR5874544.1 twin-arginine translocation signal domain-containing protein [Halomonas gomseomensis]